MISITKECIHIRYRLLSEHQEIRSKFIDTFVTPFSEFAISHTEWISEMYEKCGMEFDEKYYSEMFMWDRVTKDDRVISFADALAILRSMNTEVFFITEDFKCKSYDFCKLNKQIEYVAASKAQELADCISFEWFTVYELLEQNQYLADSTLPSDLYVFDKSFTWCLIFTHETDETESAESRLCILVDKNL